MARAAAKRRRRTAAGRGGGSLLWLQGLVCGAVLAFAMPVAVLTGVLMAPALVAAALEARPRRPVTRTVALGCCAFTLGPLWRLVTNGRGMQAALDQLADPAVAGAAWLAGACGWALCEVLPVLLLGLADMRAAVKVAALEAEEQTIRETWELDR